MNEKEAIKIVGTKYASSFWNGSPPDVVYAKQCEAAGYLEGLKERDEQLERVQSFNQDLLNGIYSTETVKKLEEQLQMAVEALEKLRTQFKTVGMHQHRLLVRDQTFESASANWEEAANVDIIDFGIIDVALEKIKAMKGKGT